MWTPKFLLRGHLQPDLFLRLLQGFTHSVANDPRWFLSGPSRLVSADPVSQVERLAAE